MILDNINAARQALLSIWSDPPGHAQARAILDNLTAAVKPCYVQWSATDAAWRPSCPQGAGLCIDTGNLHPPTLNHMKFCPYCGHPIDDRSEPYAH